MSTTQTNEPSTRLSRECDPKQSSLDAAARAADDSLAARRAGAEAVEIGRETLATTARQSEQLRRADDLADRQRYALDKSARLLRGMTWSGWVANMFTRDVSTDGVVRVGGAAGLGGGGDGNDSSDGGMGSAMMHCRFSGEQDVPEKFRPAAQSVVNFACNVQLLDRCGTDEQRAACHAICDELGDVATGALRDLNCLELDDDEKEVFDALLRDMMEAEDARRAMADATQTAGGGMSPLFSDSELSAAARGRNDDPQLRAQDAHLTALSHNLTELRGIGEALNQSFAEQNVLLDSLHVKSDSLSDQTKTITRKADRLTQRARWGSARPEFAGSVSIRHVETGKYLTASDGTAVALRRDCHDVASVWGMWRRRGDIVGLQNKLSHNWLGQTLLGYVACSASQFGRREEWEVDDDDKGGMESAAILCAGANWGNGGWLEVVVGKGDEASLVVGGYGVEAKKKAAMWCLAFLEEQEEG